jgi:hypothetical protein
MWRAGTVAHSNSCWQMPSHKVSTHLLPSAAAAAAVHGCCCLQDEVLLDVEGKNWGVFKPMLADTLTCVHPHLLPSSAAAAVHGSAASAG